jgi:topoisomerase IV subunit A
MSAQKTPNDPNNLAFSFDDGETNATNELVSPHQSATVKPTIKPVFTAAEPDLNATELGVYAERAYLDYAMSVVKGRALPQVQDGLKPVQRRILFAMQQMGLSAGAKPVKCARVVGDVLGKYHPHGDTAAYDALVRLAQSFTLRYPLIDGQGNFGSRDGDGAAAMRYTEARLTPVARLLLDELEQGSVDFINNYDGSQQEPSLLPARLPMLLLNGASGIAVGMATEMPPHNLNEVAQAALAILKLPKTDDATLMQLMPGPDFPGGGQIISTAQDIANAYRTGRGTLRTRGRYEIEDMARGQWQLVFTELPHGVSTAQVLQDIEALTNPQIKTGKKTLAPEQVQLKTLFTGLLDAARDESGKDAAVRLVFEPKSSRIEREVLINALLKHTCLESTVSLNLVCIGLDGRPRQMGLREILQQWVDYRIHTVRRRSQHHLGKLQDRIHVLEGRLLVMLSVDAVIKVIRNSDEPRPELMAAFNLSERQADDILDMRLRQLAKLEGFKIEQELAESRSKAADLQTLLDNEAVLYKQVGKEIAIDAKTYGDARRTLIEAASKADVEIPVTDEPVTVMVSAKGWVRARQGHGHDASTFSYKTGDAAWFVSECRSIDKLYAFSATGRIYTIAVSDLPSARGDGVPWTTLMDAESNPAWITAMTGMADTAILLITQQAMALRATLGDVQATRKSGKQFVNLDEDDVLGYVILAIETDHVLSISSDGRALVQPVGEIKVLAAGGKGVILQKLDDKARIAAACIVGESGVTVRGITRNKPSEDSYTARQMNNYLGKRASKGSVLDTRVRAVEAVAQNP